MRIAILIANYYPILAGAEVFAKEIAERLVREGNEVDIITGRWNKLSKYEVINGVNVYRVFVLKIKYLMYITLLFSMFFRVWKLDREKNYDIIHSIEELAAAQAGTAIKKLKNKHHVVTIQGGYLQRNDRTVIAFFFDKIIKWSLREADLIHAISTFLEDRSREYGAKRIVVIPNGVDINKFKPMNKKKLREELGYSVDKKIIISISRLVPKNGLKYLIRAMSIVSKNMPNAHLLIIGDGEQRNDLKALIKKLKLNNVELLGPIPHDDVPKYLNLADVFVRPSISEGLGVSFIEAMACGVPVLGTNVGGIPDIIEDKKNGLVVPPRDVLNLSEAIEKMLGNEDLKKRFIKEGFKRIRRKFLWDGICAEINEIYKNLLKA
jgi:glycosyltransferase involved in cell wall biosynthesis